MNRLAVLLALALALPVVAAPGVARADNPSVAEAREAIDEIRYDDARELLVQALKQGGNQPEELVEIYRLSGATAAVLGPPELAEQYYRRMLALAPDATLPADASPRLRDPFVAAQAYMAVQQRFSARATRTAQGIAVSVVDPLHMVVAVATLERGELRGKQPFANAPVVLADVGSEVVLLDESGNFLRVVEVLARGAATASASASADGGARAAGFLGDASGASDTSTSPRTPILRRWITYAIPAGLFAGASAYFFVDARRAHDRLDDIVANDSMHYFDDAETERRRWRRDTIAAWVGTGLAVGFTATAIVMAALPAPVRVTPSIGMGHASVQLEAKF